jgi:hypothetical protein
VRKSWAGLGPIANTVAAVAIEPETKNWTWVLQQACTDCGFDARDHPPARIPSALSDSVSPWRDFLQHPLAAVRPNDRTWSALEYGCHVRDVHRKGIYRLTRMLNEDNPAFENWDQDASAVEDRYDLQSPEVVAGEIESSGAEFASLYATVSGDQWDRPGLRSDGAAFTVDSFGRYYLHDLLHHIVDVRRGFEELERTGQAD